VNRTEDVDAAFREAVRAVQAQQLGPDPVIVRAALEEELAKRGITEAPLERVERMTRMLVAAQGPFASLHVMREMWDFVGEVRDAVKGPEVPEWLKPPPGREVGIPTSENPSGPGEIFEVAEVELADGVQPFLTRAFEATCDPTYAEDGEAEESNCKVWIDTRRVPASGAPLPIILGQDLIGALVGEDALALEHDLQKAEKKKQPLILEATIERERDRFSVLVIVPPV
jgi:hypothetical protein